MVSRLAEFCRWTLTRGSDEITTVAEEAEMVRAYLDIEKARWQDALVTRVEIDPATRDDRLPQFLLLPLIENAIKYGGRTSPGTLEVAVVIRTAGPSLECIVSNTGTWIESTGERTTTSTHIGLDNLRRRLMRHYGGAATLEIGRRDGWVDVRLRLSRNLDANRAATRSPLP
jgi:LytS/YehU family sensor histidine kinase